ncbi:MAG TPA: hypothetical protein VFI29_13050 [Hanamia sp.]|nr:hypothetical protein [Hanamia sp.]
MKKLFLIPVVILFSNLTFCQTVTNIDSLENHVGEKVTVCNKVYSTKFLEQATKQPTFLNLGASYPDNLLTVVIFGDDRINFKEPPEIMYDGKEICVTGEIKEFKGKPEIIVDTPDKIIIEK